VRVTMVHLPALNTPQFDWVLNRLPGRAQPVGPVFAPELAADATAWAASHDRRELHVTGAVARAIWANKCALGVLDRYLARTAYNGQHEGERTGAEPANLWAPVGGDHNAHGRFADRAREFSLQYWVTTHRSTALAVLTGAAGALLLMAGSRLPRLPRNSPRSNA
jgi:hypothetical protein